MSQIEGFCCVGNVLPSFGRRDLLSSKQFVSTNVFFWVYFVTNIWLCAFLWRTRFCHKFKANSANPIPSPISGMHIYTTRASVVLLFILYQLCIGNWNVSEFNFDLTLKSSFLLDNPAFPSGLPIQGFMLNLSFSRGTEASSMKWAKETKDSCRLQGTRACLWPSWVLFFDVST